MIDPGVMQAVELGATLFGELVKTIATLLKAGHSNEDAAKIVKRDLKSRREQYEREKAEDIVALEHKHGVVSDTVPANPFEDDPSGAAGGEFEP